MFVGSLVLASVGCGSEGDEELQHGSVKFDFRRGENVDTSPFVNTSIVEISLNYGDCLVEFYKKNPNWAKGGVDGESVFGTKELGGEGWSDELCERSDIECDVLDFRQEEASLTVTYAIRSEIENRTLHFGPLPFGALAECVSGGEPLVRVANNSAVRGLDGVPPEGEVLWLIQTFAPDQAEPDQGASITIEAEPVTQ